jgi:hypothetical protein
MIGIHARRLARLGVSMLTILVVDHPLIDQRVVTAPYGCAACRTSSRGVEGAKAAALAEVPVLVDRGELLDIPELLAAFSKT